MPTLADESRSVAYVIDEQGASTQSNVRLDSYLLASNQKVDQIVGLLNEGRPVDQDSRDWMLAQVEFIVTIIGNEDLNPGDETRAKLLQLLLSIANLNELIRRLPE